MSFPSSRSWLVLVLAAASSLVLACRGEAPPPPAALSGAAGTSAPVEAPSAARPDLAPAPDGAPALTRPPRAASTAAPRLGLMRHSGSPEGPIAYLVVEPPDARPDLPLAIALHGRGDSAEAFAGLAEALDQPMRTVVGFAPLPFGVTGGRQWYVSGAADEVAQVRARVADLAVLADQLAARYPGAPKPALYGFSQGAVVALQAAADVPERWSAVVALSGHLPTSEGATRARHPLPILVVAGDKDGVIPAERSWAAAEALAALGHAPERLAFTGGHRVPPQALEALRAFFDRVLLARAPAP